MHRFQVAVLLSFLLAGIAHADDQGTRGFYIGAGVGVSSLELQDEDSPVDFKGNDVGFKAILGYRFLKYVAVEASFADYGKQDDTVLGLRLESDFQAAYLAGVGMLPLGNADIFGKIGFAAWEGSLENSDFGVSAEEDNVDVIVGLGAQYRFGQVALRGEVEGLMLGFDDDGDDEADGDDFITLVSLGVTFTF